MQKTLKHIILGAGGAVGNPLTNELLSHGESVKLVSRRGRTIPGASVSKADLTILKEVQPTIRSVSGNGACPTLS